MSQLPEKVGLILTGYRSGYRSYSSLFDLELRIHPSESWTIDKPVYRVQWGIKHTNGNRVFGTLIDEVYYDNSENIFALALAALEALKRDGRFGHDTWNFTAGEIEA